MLQIGDFDIVAVNALVVPACQHGVHGRQLFRHAGLEASGFVAASLD